MNLYKKRKNYKYLAAAYEMASTFSCRMPMSSPHSGLALPTPGPSTVRMALIRNGIELHGIDFVRDRLFDVIATTPLYIQPSKRVAFSSHISQAYKADSSEIINKTVGYRGFAHADGPITIFIEVPVKLYEVISDIFFGIGYWGQTNSVASCVGTKCTTPKPGSFAIPLRATASGQCLGNHFTSLVTEFRDKKVSWLDVVPNAYQVKRSPFKLELYVWPLVFTERRSSGSLLRFQSLEDTKDKDLDRL